MAADDWILERVGAVIKKVFRCPDAQITPATVSVDIDGWDSLSHAMVIMGCEREFGITFPKERIYTMKDVGELCQIIGTALQTAGRPLSAETNDV